MNEHRYAMQYIYVYRRRATLLQCAQGRFTMRVVRGDCAAVSVYEPCDVAVCIFPRYPRRVFIIHAYCYVGTRGLVYAEFRRTAFGILFIVLYNIIIMHLVCNIEHLVPIYYYHRNFKNRFCCYSRDGIHVIYVIILLNED